MARIGAVSGETVFKLQKWAGLNQNPDGDTKLKFGEASVCKNFRVTRDGNLQKRPGFKTVLTVSDGHPIKCLWRGFVGSTEYLAAACNGKLYKLWDSASLEFAAAEIGDISTSGSVHMFGFSEKLYIMSGSEYKEWNGTTLSDVSGYVPLVAVAVPPAGGGTLLEGINKLNGKRRVWISPDGTAATFRLPEAGMASIDYVKNNTTGTTVPTSDYTKNLADGTVTFNSPPASGVNSYEIAWTMSTDFSASVKAMRFSELYNGTQDSRVFIYGDGSNRAFYSGLDYYGHPRADYFPDLNELEVGEANEPITAMIRHYSTLIAYKTNSAWAISFGTVTTEEGNTEAAFYLKAINKAIGCAAYGQAQLVLNSPYTVFGKDIYEWRNTASYSSNLSVDERQAKRVSDRVCGTMSEFVARDCICYDDNANQEYYICYDGRALVYNYVSDAWYMYTNMDAKAFASLGGELYFGTANGALKTADYSAKGDDLSPIDCVWQSGSMSFNQDFKCKYSATVWLGMAPEQKSTVDVTVTTDRTEAQKDKVVTESQQWFSDVDFANWTFNFNAKPQMHKLKLKAKKFVFYILKFASFNADSAATILSADIKVRFTGDAK